jgi:PHD/YefM family antitoxin component YafN of YafNO toxin-antitoxin module
VSITTISSGEFKSGRFWREACGVDGPVFINDRGRPAHVLMTYEAYRALAGQERSLLDIVAQEEDDDIEFDPPRMGDDISRPVDFT